MEKSVRLVVGFPHRHSHFHDLLYAEPFGEVAAIWRYVLEPPLRPVSRPPHGHDLLLRSVTLYGESFGDLSAHCPVVIFDTE
jgi:hypothetical protein